MSGVPIKRHPTDVAGALERDASRSVSDAVVLKERLGLQVLPDRFLEEDPQGLAGQVVWVPFPFP